MVLGIKQSNFIIVYFGGIDIYGVDWINFKIDFPLQSYGSWC